MGIGAAQESGGGESVFTFPALNLNKSVNDRDQTCIRIPFVDSGANRWDNKGKYKTDNISFQETSIPFKEVKTPFDL